MTRVCTVCDDYGVVEEVDGNQVCFSRIIACPARCPEGKKSEGSLKAMPDDWKLVDDPAVLQALLEPGARYASLARGRTQKPLGERLFTFWLPRSKGCAPNAKNSDTFPGNPWFR